MNSFSAIYFELRAQARALDLDDIGFAPVGESRTYEIFKTSAASGQCGELTYLTEEPEKRRSPASVLPDAKTLIVVALAEPKLRAASAEARQALLASPELQSSGQPLGTCVAGEALDYAIGLDYHDVLRKRMKTLSKFLQERFPVASTRAVVDTAPLLEKDWAKTAGLGFVGLNSLLVSPELGSRLFLGEILTSVSFEELTGAPDLATYHEMRDALRREEGQRTFSAASSEAACLKCRRCFDACPTGAIVGDRTLDARRCLNYWTIENRDEIPEDIKKKLDGRLFGCDLCQRVCPHNAAIESAAPQPIPLDAVERLDEATFRKLFKKTPVFRATVDGLKRSAKALRENHRGENCSH